MRILHIITGMNVGGAEYMLTRLIEDSLQTNSLNLHYVLTLTSIGELGERLKLKGIEVYTVNLKSILQLPKAFWSTRKLIRKLKPDIIQTWMYHANFFGGISAILSFKKNIVWSIRCTKIPQSGISLTSIINFLCAKLSYFIPRAIICCGEKVKDVHQTFGYYKKSMMVIPNGYYVNKRLPTEKTRNLTRQKFGINEGELLIGVCGRFDPLKDYLNFVKASKVVLKEFKAVKFMMIGLNCDLNNNELRSWLVEHNVINQFLLLGQRSDVPELLSSMDIFCLSSKAEGFPNVVCEAMSVGVPCVVTKAGDAEYIVGSTGLSVPIENDFALGEGLLSMCRLPSESRMELGRSAHKRILDNFSMDLVASKYISLYTKILTKSLIK